MSLKNLIFGGKQCQLMMQWNPPWLRRVQKINLPPMPFMLLAMVSIDGIMFGMKSESSNLKVGNNVFLKVVSSYEFHLSSSPSFWTKKDYGPLST